jgi:hypothetical protein
MEHIASPDMHTAIQLSVFWALAFTSLCLAVVLLRIFYDLIGDGLDLLSLGKEAVVAGFASLIEATSAWLIMSFIPAAARAMFVPVLIVALIYKVAHLENWSRYEIFLLLIFQAFIAGLGASLYFGRFQTAMIILAGFAVLLFIIGAFARSFRD